MVSPYLGCVAVGVLYSGRQYIRMVTPLSWSAPMDQHRIYAATSRDLSRTFEEVLLAFSFTKWNVARRIIHTPHCRKKRGFLFVWRSSRGENNEEHAP